MTPCQFSHKVWKPVLDKEKCEGNCKKVTQVMECEEENCRSHKKCPMCLHHSSAEKYL